MVFLRHLLKLPRTAKGTGNIGYDDIGFVEHPFIAVVDGEAAGNDFYSFGENCVFVRLIVFAWHIGKDNVIFYPDNLKLCSSMTLFYYATKDELFADVLEKFYGGKQDELTLNQIR